MTVLVYRNPSISLKYLFNYSDLFFILKNDEKITQEQRGPINWCQASIGKSCTVSSPLLLAFCSSELSITGEKPPGKAKGIIMPNFRSRC